MKSIVTELEDVMKTGIFHLKADTPFKLEFQRSASVAMLDSNQFQHCSVWHANDISEFVTRLGFLSTKEEMSRTFVIIYEVYVYVY